MAFFKQIWVISKAQRVFLITCEERDIIKHS